MGLITDLHLLICLVAFIYLFQKIRATTESRVLGVAMAGFVTFFIFFQHVWIAFAFFFVMFGYQFLAAFTSGYVEGQMAGAYMHYLRAAPPTMFGPQLGGMHMGTGSGTGGWFK